jgi:hypothetical protein
MLTRRDFVAKLAVASAAIGAICGARGAVLFGDAAPDRPTTRREVVSFHMDRPYVDRTGTAMPYNPPPGARSAEAAARLSEESFRRIQCYA